MGEQALDGAPVRADAQRKGGASLGRCAAVDGDGGGGRGGGGDEGQGHPGQDGRWSRMPTPSRPWAPPAQPPKVGLVPPLAPPPAAGEDRAVTEHARAKTQAEEAAPAAPTAAASALMAGFVTRLQRTAGNRAVVRMLARDAAPEQLDRATSTRWRPTASCSSSSSRARTPRRPPTSSARRS